MDYIQNILECISTTQNDIFGENDGNLFFFLRITNLKFFFDLIPFSSFFRKKKPLCEIKIDKCSDADLIFTCIISLTQINKKSVNENNPLERWFDGKYYHH